MICNLALISTYDLCPDRSPMIAQALLHLVPQVLGHDRRMLAFVNWPL
jgi:hypothetical protein